MKYLSKYPDGVCEICQSNIKQEFLICNSIEIVFALES